MVAPSRLRDDHPQWIHRSGYEAGKEHLPRRAGGQGREHQDDRAYPADHGLRTDGGGTGRPQMEQKGDPGGTYHHVHAGKVEHETRVALAAAEIAVESEADQTRHYSHDVGGTEMTPSWVLRAHQVAGHVSEAGAEGPEGGANQCQNLKPFGRLPEEIGRQTPSAPRGAPAFPAGGFSLPPADQLRV